MDEIISFFKDVFPELSAEKEDELKTCLGDLGLSTKENLKYLNPDEDLDGLFKKIENRRLKHAIEQRYPKSQSPLTPTANTPTNTIVSPLSVANNPGYEPITPTSSNSRHTGTLISNSSVQLRLLNYTIDEDRLIPKSLQRKMKGRKLPSGSELNHMVQNIVSDIRDISRHPGKKMFTGVAKHLVEKYPETFGDKYDDGELLGSGYLSLERKLMDRMANMNRKKGTPKRLNESDEDEEIPKRPKKKDSYGCVNFAPNLPEGENLDSQQEKKTWLLEQWKLDDSARDHTLCDVYMTATYATQRSVVTDKITIPIFFEEWPFLFENKYFLKHFQELMGFGLFEKAEENLEKVVPVLFGYLKSKVEYSAIASQTPEGRSEREEQAAMAVLRDDLIHIATLPDKRQQFVFVLLAIMKMWGQPTDELFVTHKDSVSMQEIMMDTNSPQYPHVAVMAETIDVGLLDTQACCVLESMVVGEPGTLYAAIMTVFAAYFVFMVEYPRSLGPTLEFIQRSYLPLPTLDQHGRRVVLSRAGESDPAHHKIHTALKVNFMILDIQLLEDDSGVINGQTNVMDFAKMGKAHMLQMTPSLAKKMIMCFQEAYPVRPKSMNYINFPTLFQAMFNMVQSFMKEKLKKRVHVHANLEDLYKEVSKDVLPKEYGGDGQSMEELTTYWKEKVESYRDWFIEDEKYKTDEKKRVGRPKTQESMFGLEGSFRQLNLD